MNSNWDLECAFSLQRGSRQAAIKYFLESYKKPNIVEIYLAIVRYINPVEIWSVLLVPKEVRGKEPYWEYKPFLRTRVKYCRRLGYSSYNLE